MKFSHLPLLIEASELENHLHDPDLLVVDLCKPEAYAHAHVPGAIHVDYQQIVRAAPPVMGLVPDAEDLSRLFSQLGIKPEHHVVAYDDEGGGKAARFLYTLDIVNHSGYSLLNGGIYAWVNEDHAVESAPQTRPASQYAIDINHYPIADKALILKTHTDPSTILVDARSHQEFSGLKRFSEKAGHIPGAVNLDWLELIDQTNNMRLKPVSELRTLLASLKVTEDKTVITYCQTHHRSALVYFTLKHLGLTKIKGYPGSWSDWGNSADTPVET